MRANGSKASAWTTPTYDFASGRRDRTPAERAPAGRDDNSVEASQGSSTPSGLLTAAQLADHWQIPVRTIYAWAKRNSMPHYRAGRLLRFDPAEVADHFRQVGFAVELTGDPDHPGESAFDLLST